MKAKRKGLKKDKNMGSLSNEKCWNRRPVSSTVVKDEGFREYEYEKWRIVNGLDKIRESISGGCSMFTNRGQAVDILSHAARRIVTNTNYISAVRRSLIDFVCWADGQNKYEKCIDKLMSLLGDNLSRELVGIESLKPEYERLQKMVEQMIDEYEKCKKSGVSSDKCLGFLDDRIKIIDEAIHVIKYLRSGIKKDFDESDGCKNSDGNVPMPRSKAKIVSESMQLKKENAELLEKLKRYEARYDEERILRLESLYGISKAVVNSLKKNGPHDKATECRIKEFLGCTASIMKHNEEQEVAKTKENGKGK